MSKAKSKFYVVWVGLKPGIYKTWKECQAQITGFPNAKYKSFKSEAEAKEAFRGSAADFISKKSTQPTQSFKNHLDKIDQNSICVDAACGGNPGLMEYRGVTTMTGEELFRIGPLKQGTNNVGEFLALVHALAFLKKLGREEVAIYSDSRTAMAWVRNKKIKSTLKQTDQNKDIFILISRALTWLSKNSYKTKILKWDTANWGEIPADFGRK